MSFTSQRVGVRAGAATLFGFVSNLDNLNQLLPDQVTNWESSGDRCSFDITGMTHLDLRIDRTEIDRLVSITSEPGSQPKIQLDLILEPDGPTASAATVELSTELSPMLQLLASTPLQNLVNIMAEKLRDHFLS